MTGEEDRAERGAEMQGPVTEPQLRRNLRSCLQSAKNLFDEGLINAKEHEVLRAHHLTLYQQESNALSRTPSSASKGALPDTSDTSEVLGAPGCSTAVVVAAAAAAATAVGASTGAGAGGGGGAAGSAGDVRTPPHKIRRGLALGGPGWARGGGGAPHSAPQLRKRPRGARAPGAAAAGGGGGAFAADDALLLGPDVYRRLYTPPILRRRARNVRRVTVAADLVPEPASGGGDGCGGGGGGTAAAADALGQLQPLLPPPPPLPLPLAAGARDDFGTSLLKGAQALVALRTPTRAPARKRTAPAADSA